MTTGQMTTCMMYNLSICLSIYPSICIRMSAYLYLHNHLYLSTLSLNVIAFAWDSEQRDRRERAFIRGLFSERLLKGPFRELSKQIENVSNNHRTSSVSAGDSELRGLRGGLCCISPLHASSAKQVTGNNRTHTANRIPFLSCTFTCTETCPLSNA